MREIARILDNSLPKPPRGLLLADALAPLWMRCAPATLQRVKPLSYSQGRLFVAVPGSAFAARLREERGALLDQLRQEEGLSELREIVVRLVEPDRPRPACVNRLMAREYPQATRSLVALACDIDDPALKESLVRLSDTLLALTSRTDGPERP